MTQKKSEVEINSWLLFGSLIILAGAVVALSVSARIKEQRQEVLKDDLIEISQQIVGGTEETYELVVSGWAYPGFIVDENGGITFANHAAGKLFLVSGSIFDQTSIDVTETHKEYLPRYSTGEPEILMLMARLIELKTKTGEMIAVRVTAWVTPLRPARFIVQVIPQTS